VWLEWTSELKAARGRELAAGKHVYNGLGIRVVSDGRRRGVEPQGTASIDKANGEPARWCAITARAGGGVLRPLGIRATPAFFVMNKAFGYMSAAPTFREPFDLAANQSIRFRWGVLAFSGDSKAEMLQRRFESWSKEKR
jgi:hypothetical protein